MGVWVVVFEPRDEHGGGFGRVFGHATHRWHFLWFWQTELQSTSGELDDFWKASTSDLCIHFFCLRR
jgi:hypothetical protein